MVQVLKCFFLRESNVACVPVESYKFRIVASEFCMTYDIVESYKFRIMLREFYIRYIRVEK